MRVRTDTASTVVAPLGSYNVVRPKTEEKRTMLKILLLATIASMALVVGTATAARDLQEFEVVVVGTDFSEGATKRRKTL